MGCPVMTAAGRWTGTTGTPVLSAATITATAVPPIARCATIRSAWAVPAAARSVDSTYAKTVFRHARNAAAPAVTIVWKTNSVTSA